MFLCLCFIYKYKYKNKHNTQININILNNIIIYKIYLNYINKMLNLIFCVDNSGLFGRSNALPWSFKEDLKYFKDITSNFNKINENNNVIVMGKNTWLSIGKKLPNRINVVISSKKQHNTVSEKPDHTFNTFDDFMNECKIGKIFYNNNIFIIGGKKLLSYVIVKYNKFIKHVFINIIQHSFPQFLDDVILKIYSFHNFDITLLSNDMIYCLNNNDGKYYYIKFNQYVNKNFNINDIIAFTNTKQINYGSYKNINYPIDEIQRTNTANTNTTNTINTINNNSHNNEQHLQYTILEDIQDVQLTYCDECDTIVKRQLSTTDKCRIICNDCINAKCKCIFC